MKRAWLAAVASAGVAGAACVLMPDIAQHGYTECDKDADCVASGRVCGSGYCSPPTWWNGSYGARRQVILTNATDRALPRGFPVRLAVGPDPRPFKVDEFSATARVVGMDRSVVPVAQVELDVAVDVTGRDSFDALVPLPVELPAGGTFADLWVYSGATGGSARADKSATVFALIDDFEDTELDAATWRTSGAATLQDGDVRVQRGGYFWSTTTLPGTPGVYLTVEFTVLSPGTCAGLTIGLIANAQSGYQVPYVALEATGSGDMVVQALRDDTFPLEPAGPTPFAIRGVASRLDLLVSGASVRAILDGTVVESFQMEGPITDDIQPHIFVEGGTCEILVHKLRMRAAVDPEPAVRAERKVARPD